MDLLVGYATAHGSTREIAQHLAARLTACGMDARARPVDGVGDADMCEAFVLGSVIHGKAWLESAKDFVRHNSDPLRFRPVWMFSVGMPDAMRGLWKRPARKEVPVVTDDFPEHIPFP
jgi:menaquinone-dependent protoporphyrinogen oxidase